MTHGRLLVRGGHADSGDIHLYTWHDGHTSEALSDWLRLAEYIFSISKENHRRLILDDHPPSSKVIGGNWFYHAWIEEILRHMLAIKPRHKTLKQRLLRWKKTFSRNNLRSKWSAMIPLQTSAISFANWFVWLQFNKWCIVPSLEWCSYPGDQPDITIDVDEEAEDRLVGYTLSFPPEEEGGSLLERIESEVEEINKRIVTPAAKVKISNSRNLSENKKGLALPTIYVPFDEMIVEYLFLDGNSLAEDYFNDKPLPKQFEVQLGELHEKRAKK